MTAKQATFELLDGTTDGTEFPGIVIKASVEARLYPESHYPATYLRYMREYRQKTGRRIVCVNKKKSLYKIG